MRSSLSAFFFCAFGFLPFSLAKTTCLESKPLIEGYQTIHGVVDHQFEIQPGAPGRLRPREGSRVIEIERLWGLGNKKILLEEVVAGEIHSIRVALYLKSDKIKGVKIWSMDYLNPKEPFLMERGDKNEWKFLDFNLVAPVKASNEFSFNFYARTIFKNPMSPVNLATGTRVDACVYFLLKLDRE